ncbi:MAG: AtpZ/AtpI family protein [Deltaproteobacteria bacterium]|nr:AtpZ/AtpI family protein [Deltaproteobacteria bacterium]
MTNKDEQKVPQGESGPLDGKLSALEAHLDKKEKLDEKSLVYRTFYRTLGQGLELGMSVVVGVIVGIVVDKQFDSKPWGLLWFSFAGLVASILSARKLMKTSKEAAKTGPAPRNLYEEDDSL